MANYQEMRVKLTNTQLHIIKICSENKIGTILRLNKKDFEDEELPSELFLMTGKTTKLRNVFADNI